MKQITTIFLVTSVLLVVLSASASPVVAASKSTATPFKVTSIEVSVTPATLSTWQCGAFIQIVYHALFHVTSGPSGGVISFSTTVNNGRAETPEKLTIIPGQSLTDFTWTWQGALPPDHTQPGPGGILVTAPNTIISPLVAPSGACR